MVLMSESEVKFGRDAVYDSSKLSPELLEVARKELNEDPKRAEADLEALRQWVQKQPHLICRTDDRFLIPFLRNCKFSLERTKAKLDNYCTVRTAAPEWTRKTDPMGDKIQEILSIGCTIPLPGYGKNGQKVVISRAGIYDPDRISINDVMKVELMIQEIQMRESDQFQIKGVIGIVDFSGFSGSHASQFTPSYLKKLLSCWQECMPIRLKEVYYWNTPSWFDTIYSIIKLFLKDKMKKRLTVCGKDLTVLQNSVGLDVLPTEYGGRAGSIDSIKHEWKEKIMSYREQFLYDERYGTDESKRAVEPSKANKLLKDVFNGIQGSFRKLEID